MSEGVREPGVAFDQELDAPVPESVLEAAWTPEAAAAVERAEVELATGGGLPHDDVKRRTRQMLGR